MLLSERLPYAASLYPEAPALLRHGQTISYEELHHRAREISFVLYADGLRKGDRIALIGDPDPSLVSIFFAAIEIGAIPLILSPMLTVHELEAIFQDATPFMVYHDERHAKTVINCVRLLAYQPILFSTNQEGHITHSPDSLLQQNMYFLRNEYSTRCVDDTAVLIYTGGTTGKPKGVMHSHRGMAAWNHLSPLKSFGYDPDRRVLVLNLSHLVGQFQLWATMAAGGCLVFLDEYPANVHLIMDTVERDRITLISTVGQLLRDLTRESMTSGRKLESLKVIGCGGSIISPNTLRHAVLQFPGALIVNNYSQAECGMSISRLFPAQHMDNPVRLQSVGRPSDLAAQGEQAYEVKILDTDGRELVAGEAGEIVVRGLQNMLGYWRQLQATVDAMSGGWIRTGDIGFLDKDGYLYVLDRLKDMVIVGGSNVYCSEVEQVISSHEGISDVAILGIPLPDEGEELVAVVVLKENITLNLKQLRAYCQSQLANYKWPTKLFILESLPRTAVDKVDKKQLRKELTLSLS